jgi:predicted metal-dependent hydrolase
MRYQPYTLRPSKRARRMRLSVYCDGSCVVTAPVHISQRAVETFVNQKSEWIQRARKRFAALSHIIFVKKRKRSKKESAEHLALKAQALQLATEKIAKFNAHYGFTFSNINIKNQKTRWGSCSRKGNLNFNYKIALLPEKLADYIIVHEICHLGEFNHSRAFWSLVGETIPDYRALRSELRRVGVREV